MYIKVASYPCLYSVDVGEALGLHSALQWLSDMQFDNVDFETYSKMTSDAFHATRDNTSKFGCIISSCRSLYSSFFTNSRVEFVRQQANGVAHALAGEAAADVFKGYVGLKPHMPLPYFYYIYCKKG